MNPTTDANETTTALGRLATGRLRQSDLGLLPNLVTTDVAAGAFGISVKSLYQLIALDRCPVEPLRVGARSLRFRTADIAAMLLGAAT